jgi:hypothetical protein
MSATLVKMLKNAEVTHYQFLLPCIGRSDDDPVRWATKVTLTDGRLIRLPDRLNRRAALREAEHYLRHEQG